MPYDWPLYLCLFLALWSAIVGGVFSAFSEFIMTALLRAAPASGIEAMQQINHTVIKTQFVAGIMLISVFSVLFALYAQAAFSGYALVNLILASIVYVASVFLMTIAGNVPMNKRLDGMDPKSSEAAAYWTRYGRVWTRLNHVRSVGSVLTSVLYLIAAVMLIESGQV
ncbi:MAG: anthrone oxygenase family protein [Pseudomonadota bacterium]